MDNSDTLTTLGTQDEDKQNTKTQNIKLKRWITRIPPNTVDEPDEPYNSKTVDEPDEPYNSKHYT